VTNARTWVLAVPAMLVVASLLLLPPERIEAQTPATHGFASGSVRDAATDLGIMGALLRALDTEGRVVARGFSGQGGRFDLELPAGGPYRLEVQSMGFREAVADSLLINAPDTLRLGPVELVPHSSELPQAEEWRDGQNTTISNAESVWTCESSRS